MAAPAAVAVCTRVVIWITPDWSGEKTELVPCAVTQPNSIEFFEGKAREVGDVHGTSWISKMPPNETGASYLSYGDLGGNWRSLTKGAKAFLGTAPYFASLFGEPLVNYQAAAVTRNDSVSDNLRRIRNAAKMASADLTHARAERETGAAEVAKNQLQQLATNVAANNEIRGRALSAQIGVATRLSQLPPQTKSISLAEIAARNQFPPDVSRRAADAVDTRHMVGSASLAGDRRNVDGIANAADLLLTRYEKLDSAKWANPIVKQGTEALRQAKHFAQNAPQLAGTLYAQGRSALAFITGESASYEVAVWDSERHKFTLAPDSIAVNRVLPLASFFGDQTGRLKAQVAKAAGPEAQRPPDTVVRVTEQIVSDAEASLDSDPIKSLGGLFRARTLMENAELYGGAFKKLTKWAVGAAGRMRTLFGPPPDLSEPGMFGKYIALEVSKKLKGGIESYRNAIEAGEYGMLGINKVQDIFGEDTLTELKSSLKLASEAAMAEAKPLDKLDEVAPTVELWVLSEARAANATNSQNEVKELLKLRDLYMNRIEKLHAYSSRLEVLSRLSDVYAQTLSDPSWLMVETIRCMGTACAANAIALSDQLYEVSGLSATARREALAAAARYESQLKQIDQLVEAWLAVLPDPSVFGYRRAGQPVRDLGKKLP